MQIIEIMVNSGKRVSNPYQPDSHLQSGVLLKGVAGVEEPTWTAEAAVAATQALQKLADQLVEEDLERRLKRLKMKSEIRELKAMLALHRLHAQEHRQWAAEQQAQAGTSKKSFSAKAAAAELETAEKYESDAAATETELTRLQAELAAFDAGEPAAEK